MFLDKLSLTINLHFSFRGIFLRFENSANCRKLRNITTQESYLVFTNLLKIFRVFTQSWCEYQQISTLIIDILEIPLVLIVFSC